MKKIIAILLALAVVSMAFAQTVSISNTLSTDPAITINGGTTYWGFDSAFLTDEVKGEAITADGRAKVKGVVKFQIDTLTPDQKSEILSFKPRWSWNSGAVDKNGNKRSGAAAILKPIDSLEIGIGNLGLVGYDKGAGPNLDWSEWSTWYAWGFAAVPGVVGQWQRLSSLVYDGVHVVWTGVPNLWVGAGLSSAYNGYDNGLGDNAEKINNRVVMLKKGLFHGISVGAGYGNDLFGVGAIYKGNFGAQAQEQDRDPNTLQLQSNIVGGFTQASELDKAYQDHTIYANFTFKGLQEAKIGTTIYADVGFYTAKKSNVRNNAQTTSFLFNVGTNLNFRNGISDDISVAVGYSKIGGVTSKVLPFHIRNTIKYSVSSDANFSFVLGYCQAGLSKKKSATAADNFGATNLNGVHTKLANAGNVYTFTDNAAVSPTTNGGYGWLVYAYPSFSWNMGASSFNLGIKTTVRGDIVPHAKSGWEWAWTGLRGREAWVCFPLSWTYNF